jgi:putative component of membrane protein insertase Oxa1/YidC/SpoIIIJ protein YidD
MRIFYVVAFILSCTACAEEPWGKDADMLCPPCVQGIEVNQGGALSRLGTVAIRFHQKVISPADGPRSHHYPSSSQYTMTAMRRYGFAWGFLFGCDRLMRENADPWIYPRCLSADGIDVKYNPVP